MAAGVRGERLSIALGLHQQHVCIAAKHTGPWPCAVVLLCIHLRLQVVSKAPLFSQALKTVQNKELKMRTWMRPFPKVRLPTSVARQLSCSDPATISEAEAVRLLTSTIRGALVSASSPRVITALVDGPGPAQRPHPRQSAGFNPLNTLN